jgi:hypothetical protein
MTERKIIIQTFPPLLDVPLAAFYIQMAEKTLRNEISGGTFPVKPIRRGRKVLFKKKDLDRYVDELK